MSPWDAVPFVPLLKWHTMSSDLNPMKSPVSTPARQEVTSGRSNGLPCQVPPSAKNVKMRQVRTSFLRCRWQSAGRRHSCVKVLDSQEMVQSEEFVRNGAGHKVNNWTTYWHFLRKNEPELTEWNTGAYEALQMIILIFPVKAFMAFHVTFCVVTAEILKGWSGPHVVSKTGIKKSSV